MLCVMDALSVCLQLCGTKVSGSHLACAGDLARWLPTGCIEFLGRIDNQVWCCTLILNVPHVVLLAVLKHLLNAGQAARLPH